MLEWYRVTNRFALLAAVIGAAFVLIVGGISGGGYSWLNSIWGLVLGISVPLLTGLALYFSNSSEWVAGGADWVAHNTGWVDVYELTQIKSRVDVTVVKLCLADTAGRKMNPSVSLLQHNRNLWDLVYNGILHSIRDRDVETDHIARQTLQLHGPLMARDVVEGRYRDGDSVATGKRPRRGRLYRRGRRQS